MRVCSAECSHLAHAREAVHGGGRGAPVGARDREVGDKASTMRPTSTRMHRARCSRFGLGGPGPPVAVVGRISTPFSTV